MRTTKRLRIVMILVFVSTLYSFGKAEASIEDIVYKYQFVEHADSIVLQPIDSTGKINVNNIIRIKKNCKEEELTKALSKLRNVKFENNAKVDSILRSKWKLSIQEYEMKQKDSVATKFENIKGDNIGILYVKSKKIKACILQRNNFGIYSNEKSAFEVQIDSVEIAFESGQIKDMIVKTISTEKYGPLNFTNPNYIPVRNSQDFDRFSKKGEFYLISSFSKDSIIALDFADVLYFNRKISGPSGTYIPNDTNIVVKPGLGNGVKLCKSSMINNLDLRVFTDVLGYNNQSSPNGIIQSDIQLNFGLNQGSSKFTIEDAWSKETKHFLQTSYRYKFIWVNRISPFIKLSRIENTDKELLVTETKTKNLLDLYKYSNTNIGTELNLFTYKTDSKLFTGNVGVGVLRTKVGKDTINNTNFNVSTAYINPGLNFQFFESNRIDFNFKLGAYCGWLVTSIDPEIFSTPGHSITDYITQGEHWWYEIGQSINLHPTGNRSGSIFIRASQFLSTNNNHFTFQIGYATTISNILKF